MLIRRQRGPWRTCISKFVALFLFKQVSIYKRVRLGTRIPEEKYQEKIRRLSDETEAELLYWFTWKLEKIPCVIPTWGVAHTKADEESGGLRKAAVSKVRISKDPPPRDDGRRRRRREAEVVPGGAHGRPRSSGSSVRALIGNASRSSTYLLSSTLHLIRKV